VLAGKAPAVLIELSNLRQHLAHARLLRTRWAQYGPGPGGKEPADRRPAC